MARIRTIKPEFFTSSDIVALSPLARLLFIGLWGEADREGRMKWRPGDFKLRILPSDDIDIHGLCAEIVKQGLVTLYGDGLACIPTFAEHQHVNPRETASRLPVPPKIDAHPTREHASNLDVHAQGGREGEGREGKDSEAIASGAGAPPDPIKVLFDDGVKLLTENGCKPDNARALVGKWRKDQGDEATQAAIKAARAEGVTEPIAWITMRFAGKPRENWNDRRIRETREALRTA